MENRQLDRVQERLASYNLFSYFFLALPDEEFVRNILGLQLEQLIEVESQQGIKLIRKYITGCRVKSSEAVLQELAIDRTHLLRGIAVDGPRPPYESLYLKESPQDTMGSLNTFYYQENYTVSQEIHESSEYLGIELSFMKELCSKELFALQENNSEEKLEDIRRLQQDFLARHLGRWAGLFAKEMIKTAKTDFYRGLGYLLQDFIAEEMAA